MHVKYYNSEPIKMFMAKNIFISISILYYSDNIKKLRMYNTTILDWGNAKKWHQQSF